MREEKRNLTKMHRNSELTASAKTSPARSTFIMVTRSLLTSLWSFSTTAEYGLSMPVISNISILLSFNDRSLRLETDIIVDLMITRGSYLCLPACLLTLRHHAYLANCLSYLMNALTYNPKFLLFNNPLRRRAWNSPTTFSLSGLLSLTKCFIRNNK